MAFPVILFRWKVQDGPVAKDFYGKLVVRAGRILFVVMLAGVFLDPLSFYGCANCRNKLPLLLLEMNPAEYGGRAAWLSMQANLISGGDAVISWEVSAGELAKMKSRGGIISLCTFNRVFVVAERIVSFCRLNLRVVHSVSRVKANASILAIFLLAVPTVFDVGANAEIIPSIVERVPVFMIDFHANGAICNQAVHEHLYPLDGCHCAATVAAPRIDRQEREQVVINKTQLAIRELNVCHLLSL